MNNLTNSLFKVGGGLNAKMSTATLIFGMGFILFVWYLVTDGTGWVGPATIPSPKSVFFSFIEMYERDGLISNTIYSIKLNIRGYVEAITLSLPVGFLIALIPLFRGMFSKMIDALRYVPLTGLIGVFIAWYGIGTPMKAHFLAFGIIVYLLPIVVQRVYETEKVHLDTAWTLGANSWQTFYKVYLPSTLSKVFVDIRVITAISWTYIIVAEMVNNEGGVGAMIYSAAKQSRLDKIFAVIVLIIVIGIIQDKLFQWLEKIFFKFKFAQK
jgi:NitT/TauT family transport system permease protein